MQDILMISRASWGCDVHAAIRGDLRRTSHSRTHMHLPGHAKYPRLKPSDESQPPPLCGSALRYLRLRSNALLIADSGYVRWQRSCVGMTMI